MKFFRIDRSSAADQRPTPGSRAAYRVQQAEQEQIDAIEAGLDQPGRDGAATSTLAAPAQPGVAQGSETRLQQRRARQQVAARADFPPSFHLLNVVGSGATSLSAVGCGLGAFAHIGEYCGSHFRRPACTAAGFGMAGVIIGVLGAGAGVTLAWYSLRRGETLRWRRWNFAASLANVVAALAAGGPAMYALFDRRDPSTCGRGSANQAAFAGFWVGVVAAASLALQSQGARFLGMQRNGPGFRAANAASTGLAAVASILAAAPALCATNQSVQHGGGGQAVVAIFNCLGVVAGFLGGAGSAVGAFF